MTRRMGRMKKRGHRGLAGGLKVHADASSDPQNMWDRTDGFRFSGPAPHRRAGMEDPRGTWAAGVPASGGFYPQKGVRFAQTGDPLSCDDDCSESARCGPDGRSFSSAPIRKPNQKPGTNGLPRFGAAITRGANAMIRQQRSYSGTSLKIKAKKSSRGIRRKSRG